MSVSRLELAVEAGTFAVPDSGRILVLRPRAGDDLTALPKDRVHVVQGFRPDHDHFAAQGYATASEPEGEYAAAVVHVPRAKVEARGLIALAAASLPPAAQIAVDGLKTDGVDSILRDVRRVTDAGEAIAKSHGKIFVLSAPEPGPAAEALARWLAEAGPVTLDHGFRTVAGVFSADGIDRGSAMLVAALPGTLKGVGADLGAGWGYLSAEALTRPGITEMHLIEAEKAALDCAQANITDPRARFHWADATRFQPERRFDFILTNPPFHTSRAADPAIGAAFIRAAGRMLSLGGSFWMVANRHLPYEKVLLEAFREVEEIGGDGAFKLTRAAKPVTQSRR